MPNTPSLFFYCTKEKNMIKKQEKRAGFYSSEEDFLRENPKPEDQVCRHGVAKGKHRLEKTDHPDGTRWRWTFDFTPCEKCYAEEKEAEEKERLAEQKRKAFLKLPARFGEAPEKSRYYGKYLEKGGVLFSGDVGTGKTFELVSLVKNIFVETGELPELTPSAEMGVSLRKAVNSGSYHDALFGLANVPVFCLDDLGSEITTEFFKEALFVIVNWRYARRLPIILTTNLSKGEIIERYGQPLLSRLIEAVEIVRLEGRDRRKERN